MTKFIRGLRWTTPSDTLVIFIMTIILLVAFISTRDSVIQTLLIGSFGALINMATGRSGRTDVDATINRAEINVPGKGQ